MTNSPIDLIIDALGQPCPAPIIALGRSLERVQPGEVIGVVADDPAAAYDVPAWCRMRRQEFLGHTTVDGDKPVYLIRRVS